MAVQRQEIKERLDAGTHQKIVVDLDEIIEKWVSVTDDHSSAVDDRELDNRSIGVENVGIIQA